MKNRQNGEGESNWGKIFNVLMLLGHGKNGVGYIVLKIPIQIMNLCTSAVQQELKYLTSTKGEYLFMNADEGSTHPSGTRRKKFNVLMLLMYKWTVQPQRIMHVHSIS